VQDTQYVSSAKGCALQGENLHFPDLVEPAGSRETRNLTVDVVDFLTMSADRDRGCSSVNRITIQNVGNASADDVDVPLLSCSRIPSWCAPPAIPRNAHRRLPADMSPLVSPLGSQVEFECDTDYFYKLGTSRLFCGTEMLGQTGQWRSLDGSQSFLEMACIKNRMWCPALPNLGTAAVLTTLKPATYEVGSRATFGCLRGYRPGSDWTASVQCFLGDSGTQGKWLMKSSQGSWVTPPHTLNCELIPDYCPPLRSASRDLVVPAGLLTADEPWLYETIIQNTTIPVVHGALGATANSSCPLTYQQVGGTNAVLCSHGTKGTGVWQPAHDPGTQLLDEVVAEPVVCELEPLYGVHRHYFTTPMGRHGGSGSDGHDVVPNLDQQSSMYDAAQFEAYLVPPHSGVWTLSVEVVGRFLLALRGRVLLTGRSGGAKPQLYIAGGVKLLSSEYYALSLQYTMDPKLPQETDVSPIPRRVRLLWASPPLLPTPVVVPSTAFRHNFKSASGFPRVLKLTNDPNSCISGQAQDIAGLQLGATGVIFDGDPNRDYNQDLRCRWVLRSAGLARFNFYVNFWDIQYTPGCTADYVRFSQGTVSSAESMGDFCGQYSNGTAITSLKTAVVIIDFYTDSLLEGQGFNITYVVAPSASPLPEGLVPQT